MMYTEDGVEEVEVVTPKKVRKTVKKVKPEVVEVELVDVVEEQVRQRLDDGRVASIQERIITLNDDADSITTKALSNVQTSDLSQYQETLVAAIMAIQEATGEREINQETGVLSGFWKKLGNNFGFIKKIQKSVEEKFIESATLQDNIDRIFESLEGSIQATEKDVDTLAQLQYSLKDSVGLATELIVEIEVMMSELGDTDEDMMEKSKLDGLMRELKSINLVNNNTANQLSAQITTTGALATNLREVRPILKNLMKSQTLVALQNARMGQAKEVRDLVAGVVNDFVTKNNQTTQETILDAIEYSGKTIIKQETVAALGTQHDAFVKELRHIVTDLNKAKLEYTRTVDHVTNKLGQGLSELPRLMAGDTTTTTKRLGGGSSGSAAAV